jgi:hypothetical protein
MVVATTTTKSHDNGQSSPDFALRYITSHRRCARDEWTDPLWADGGALVDIDERRLLFFGDELMTTMPERHAMLAALAVTWSDYSVGWAYGAPTRSWHMLAQNRAGPSAGTANY